MSHPGDDDDRPRKSWSEIDRLREKGSSGSERERRPRGRHAEAQARRATERYVKEIDSLFSSAEGGSETEPFIEAMRDAHGSGELPAACRAYRDAIGFPEDPELVSLFLDSGEQELVVGALEVLLAAAGDGRVELTGSLRSQVAVLAEDFDDAVASVAEDILAAS